MLTEPLVAPYIGAWIEIVIIYLQALIFAVAPYIGAWIEIQTNFL